MIAGCLGVETASRLGWFSPHYDTKKQGQRLYAPVLITGIYG